MPEEILVVDSSSEDSLAAVCGKYEKVALLTIPQKSFDHGGTRDMALRHCRGEIVVFLTQDALPADSDFLTHLIAPLSDKTVAVSYGRQLPKPDATKREALIRQFNYPPESCVRSRNDISRLGIKAFFSSDVCAAYPKALYLSLGGFEQPVKSNEDMFYAAKALHHGYRIAYAAEARVYHSHNLTLREQYYRNFAQGYEIERHRKMLGEVSLNGEGLRFAAAVSWGLLKKGAFASLIAFGLDCGARWIGNKNGKRAFQKEEKTNVKN